MVCGEKGEGVGKRLGMDGVSGFYFDVFLPRRLWIRLLGYFPVLCAHAWDTRRFGSVWVGSSTALELVLLHAMFNQGIPTTTN